MTAQSKPAMGMSVVSNIGVFRDSFIDARVHQLFDHWLSLASSDSIPTRQQIDPLAVKTMLPTLVIIDCRDLQEPVYRLAGEEINARNRQSLNGKRMRDTMPADVGDILIGAIRRICRDRLIIHGSGEIPTPGGRPQTVERLGLPLSEDGRAVDHVLGASIQPRFAEELVAIGEFTKALKYVSLPIEALDL